jgi:hypothetical protein
MSSGRFGEMLVRANLITSEQLDDALALQKSAGGRIGSILVKLGYVNEEAIASFLGRQYGVPAVDLGKAAIDPAVLKLVPAEVARKHLLIPLGRSGGFLVVAMADPSDIVAIDEVRFVTGHNIQPMIAQDTSIRNAVKTTTLYSALSRLNRIGTNIMSPSVWSGGSARSVGQRSRSLSPPSKISVSADRRQRVWPVIGERGASPAGIPGIGAESACMRWCCSMNRCGRRF